MDMIKIEKMKRVFMVVMRLNKYSVKEKTK
jgi:hypothetical protein